MINERNNILINRKFKEYLIPTILTNAAISLAFIIDSIMVGQLLGEDALSAAGLAVPVIYGMYALFLLFSVGGVTAASIAKGKRETRTADCIFTLTFVAGIAIMLIFLIIILLFIEPITKRVAQGDVGIQALTREYILPVSFSGLFMMLSLGMAMFVRADGKPVFAAVIALIPNIVNIILGFVFMKYLGMGVTGAGLSTTLGYALGVFVLLPYFFSKQRTFKFVNLLKQGDSRPQDLKQLKSIVGIGMPDTLSQVFSFLRTLILNLIIMNALGASGMTAMMVCINAYLIYSIIIDGTAETLTPISSTLYGEKDYSGVRFTVISGLRFILIACAVIMLIFLFMPGFMALLFGVTSAAGIAAVIPALRMYSVSLILSGTNSLLQSFFQTTGRENLSSLIVTLRKVVYITFFAVLLAGFDAKLVWLAFLFAEAATFLTLICIGVYIRKKEKVSGILLLHNEKDDTAVIDLSESATIESAVGLSKRIVQFCTAHGADKTCAVRMGVAVEEMAINTSLYAHKNRTGAIDAMVRITDDELILRFRDDGLPFDPTQYRESDKDEVDMEGIKVMKLLAKSVSYTRQLGFNVTIITVPKVIPTQGDRENE